MADRVQSIEQPLALTSLHAVVSKSHPQARTILHYINTSMAKLRDSGEYERILARHLAQFWGAPTKAKAPSGATPDEPKISPALTQGVAPIPSDAVAQ
jgi:hypothetical protein